jgi:hypothetical protein
MATVVDPNLPPLFCNIGYSLKLTIKEPALMHGRAGISRERLKFNTNPNPKSKPKTTEGKTTIIKL